MGKVIYGRLNGETAAGGRVRPLLLLQDPDYPAISYQKISETRLHNMGQDSGTRMVRGQVNCWAETYADARSLAEEVEGRLSRFSGTVNGVEVVDIILNNEIESYMKDSKSRRIMQDYTFILA
jgi:hypothetical protein